MGSLCNREVSGPNARSRLIACGKSIQGIEESVQSETGTITPSTQEEVRMLHQFQQDFQKARQGQLDFLRSRFPKELKSSIGNFEIKLRDISDLPPLRLSTWAWMIKSGIWSWTPGQEVLPDNMLTGIAKLEALGVWGDPPPFVQASFINRPTLSTEIQMSCAQSGMTLDFLFLACSRVSSFSFRFILLVLFRSLFRSSSLCWHGRAR